MRLAREKGHILVLGGDVNAQNTLFGGKITNKRGKQIEDLLVEYDLAVATREIRLHARPEIQARSLISC